MKRVLLNLTALFVAAVMLLLPAAGVYAAGYYMAYNFYSDPVLTGTSGKFDTFMIDFRGVKTPKSTYWSLCNFRLDLSSAATMTAYPNLSGMGAYCGLQNTTSEKGRTGILSFWEGNYKAEGAVWTQFSDGSSGYAVNGEKVRLRASRVYPSGSGTFGGEGEGTNIIEHYPWEDGKWYTCMLHSWTDAETGTTFVGEWYRNNETGEWLLFSYFDTHLYQSFLRGGMSQFQENYSEYSYNYVYERECNLKNMYAYDHVQQKWQSLNTSTLSYGDGGGNNKAGAHSFGVDSDADGEFWWGSTGGEVEDQAAYEAAAVRSGRYTIDQPQQPDLSGAPDPVVQVVETANGREVRWSIPATAAPQLAYTVNVYDFYGNLLFTKYETRPEKRAVDLSEIDEEAIRCEVLIDSVFDLPRESGQGVSEAYEHPSVLEAGNVQTVHGETFELSVNVVDNAGFNSFDFDLSYDPAFLEFVSADVFDGAGNAIGGDGQLNLTYDGSLCDDDRQVARLTFRALKTGETTVTPVVGADKNLSLRDGGSTRALPTVARASTVSIAHDPNSDFVYEMTCTPLTVRDDSLTISLSMRNPPEEIYGFSVEICFDPAKLAFNEGVFSRYFPYARAVNFGSGVVRVFGATKIDEPVTEDSPMVDLFFDVIDPDMSVGSTYEFSMRFYNNQPAYSLDDQRHTKHITDVGTSSLTAVVTAGDDAWDLDGSGRTDIDDVTCLLDRLAQTASFDARYDLDGNNRIDIDDVTKLLDHLSGV